MTPFEILQEQYDVIQKAFKKGGVVTGTEMTANLPKKDGEIEMVMCGHCEKKITPNLIASFGADHHDPDQTMCESCFAGAIDTAEARAETL